MSRFALAAITLALAPSALAAPAVVTFDQHARIVVDENAGSVTVDGDVQFSSCTTDLVKETPIDPAFIPCDGGAAFVLLVDNTGAPIFGLHGAVDHVSDASVTLQADDLLLMGDVDHAPHPYSTDVYGIFGVGGTDFLAIWGTDGTAIWGTDGAVIPADTAGMWSRTVVAIWGTGGVAIWGTDGAVIDPDLRGVVASAGFLPEIDTRPEEAWEALPSTDLAALVHKGVAVPLETVEGAELAMRSVDLCKTFGCN